MKKSFLSLILFLLIFTSAQASAGDKLDLRYFSEISILHEGRIKPLESFSLSLFKKFSNNKIKTAATANVLLAKTIFSPEQAVNEPVFFIKNPYEYGLPDRADNLYNYVQILSLIEQSQDKIQVLTNKPVLDNNEKEFLSLAANQISYAEILRSLTALIPIHVADEKVVNYIDLKSTQDRENTIKKIRDAKGQISNLTEEDQQKIIANFAYDTIQAGGRNNIILKVIKAKEGDEWFSLWEIISRDNENRYNDIVQKWKTLATSYRQSDSVQFKTTSKELKKENTSLKVQFEKWYNQLDFLNLSLVIFLMGFLSLSIRYYFPQLVWRHLPFTLTFVATIMLTMQITGRIFIMERPPVGTLYESILFVAWIAALNSILVAFIQRKDLWLSIGSGSAIILICVSYFFAKEDDMQPLVAVLNSNFWLLTHVLIVTAGYGFCLLSSIYAHILLFNISGPSFRKEIRPLLLLSAISLFLITFGTILGGLWADQSWGRFWGWDPKENGALIILLWISWLLHARLTHYSTDRLFTAGIALLSVIVSIAWFGVNLLNVGLHSYGFTNGIFWGLVSFCIFEFVVISGLYYRKKYATLNS